MESANFRIEDHKKVLTELLENMQPNVKGGIESFLSSPGYIYAFLTKVSEKEWILTDNERNVLTSGTLNECVNGVLNRYW